MNGMKTNYVLNNENIRWIDLLIKIKLWFKILRLSSEIFVNKKKQFFYNTYFFAK